MVGTVSSTGTSRERVTNSLVFMAGSVLGASALLAIAVAGGAVVQRSLPTEVWAISLATAAVLAAFA